MKPIQFWVSGINFDETSLPSEGAFTAFLTLDDPGKPEAIPVIEKLAYARLSKTLVLWAQLLCQCKDSSPCEFHKFLKEEGIL